MSEIPKPEYRIWKTFIRVTVITSLAVITTVTICAYLWLKTLGVFNLNADLVNTLNDYNYTDNSLVFDRKGQKIGELFKRYHVFVPYNELPQDFINALIAIEDRSFYEHPGIDIKGITRAVYVRLRTGKSTQGASTITQQLVRRAFLTPDKTIERKILEIAWALKVEKTLTKEKIMEIYTNSMFLGHGAYGVGAAAHRYFGRPLKELNSAELALIAGLFQSPSRYNPAKYPERAKKRQLQVLEAMRRYGFINQEQAQLMRTAPLSYKPYVYLNTQKASWFVDYVQDILANDHELRKKNIRPQGLRIYTTLDDQLQTLAERSVASHEPRFHMLEARTGKILDPKIHGYRNARLEAAMLVTDPRTGDILAMVGGRDYRTSQFNRTINAMRSPGSAFKPIVFTEALVHGYKWSDMIFVSPVNIENYRPKNIDEDYLSETTLLRAFYRSMNAPTIEIAGKIGLPAIISRANLLGVQSPLKHEFGTVLGSSEVTMADLARVYGTYASSGILTELSPILKITNADGEVLWERPILTARQKRALNSQIAYLMTQGMKAVMTSGTASRSSDLAHYAAGKTGTSNDSADNWFCGYTPDMVSIVWVGTDEHAPIFSSVSGGSLALPIWDQFLRSTLSIRPPKPFYRPEGIVEATVHPRYGHRVASGAHMYFLNGNQPLETENALEKVENHSEGGFRHVFRH
jgi:1A family penicillin-binding protein